MTGWIPGVTGLTGERERDGPALQSWGSFKEVFLKRVSPFLLVSVAG